MTLLHSSRTPIKTSSPAPSRYPAAWTISYAIVLIRIPNAASADEPITCTFYGRIAGCAGWIEHIVQAVTGFAQCAVQDKARSDSLDAACKLIRMNPLVRSAVGLIRGIEIRINSTHFHMNVCSIVSWFKVREMYLLDGSMSLARRRDMRRGQHRGRVAVSPTGGLTLFVDWDEPLGGNGEDEFVLVNDDELHVTTTLRCRGQTVQYTQVYTRKR